MDQVTRLALIAALTSSLAALIGCSSAQKPAETTISVPATSPAPQAAVKPGIQRAQSSGSLQDLQQGRASETPKESQLKEIYFDFDDYRLKFEARETLKADADWLSKNPALNVQVEGNCDERGTSEYNLALGAKRAQAAKDYLMTLGIAPARLTTISYGSEIPVCREHNEECWQKNRRDRFVALTSKPGV
jgi:peptidoglycan-associated lipoprotein